MLSFFRRSKAADCGFNSKAWSHSTEAANAWVNDPWTQGAAMTPKPGDWPICNGGLNPLTDPRMVGGSSSLAAKELRGFVCEMPEWQSADGRHVGGDSNASSGNGWKQQATCSWSRAGGRGKSSKCRQLQALGAGSISLPLRRIRCRVPCACVPLTGDNELPIATEWRRLRRQEAISNAQQWQVDNYDSRKGAGITITEGGRRNKRKESIMTAISSLTCEQRIKIRLTSCGFCF